MLQRNSARPIIDSIVIAVLLVLANLVFGFGDRGWIGLNPSPYLLLPLLIGGKYGLRAGLMAGLMALFVSAAMAWTTGMALMEALGATPLVFLAMPVVGLVSGELQRQSAGRRKQLEADAGSLGQQNERLEKALEIARESQYVLQKELSLQGADVCSLDLELRKIFEAGAPPVLRGTLLALGEVSGVTDAAFYLLDDGGESLRRSEHIGDGAYFPEAIGSRHTKMAWAAIDSGELVSCLGLGEGRGDIGQARFLAAVPWRRDGQVVGVLLIHDMPFLAMNWQNLARIELVCDWVASMEALRERHGAEAGVCAADQGEFRALLEMAGGTFERHGLPSAVAILTAAGAMAVGEIRDSIAGALRPTDVTISVGGRGLAVLFPLEAGRDAETAVAHYLALAKESGSELSVKLLRVAEPVDPDQIWDEIVASVG